MVLQPACTTVLVCDGWKISNELIELNLYTVNSSRFIRYNFRTAKVCYKCSTILWILLNYCIYYKCHYKPSLPMCRIKFLEESVLATSPKRSKGVWWQSLSSRSNLAEKTTSSILKLTDSSFSRTYHFWHSYLFLLIDGCYDNALL